VGGYRLFGESRRVDSVLKTSRPATWPLSDAFVSASSFCRVLGQSSVRLGVLNHDRWPAVNSENDGPPHPVLKTVFSIAQGEQFGPNDIYQGRIPEGVTLSELSKNCNAYANRDKSVTAY
jgi:hypothetical protein